MLQEIIARSIGAELGTYRHFVGSMHIYEHQDEQKNDVAKAVLYLGEALQGRIEMPEMPVGDPWPALETIRKVEPLIRAGTDVNVECTTHNIDPYWADLVRLLLVFAARGDDARIDAIKSTLVFKKYSTYIQARKGLTPRKAKAPAKRS
jgi:thymidylate synthase